jgi:hypothetical protein
MDPMLFLLKLVLTPILVAAVSLAARRWGATVGGLLLGLPWLTGPILFFLALDKGDTFAAAACTGVELGVVCIAAYLLAYGLVSLAAGWPLSLASAVLAFLGTAWVTQELALPLTTAAAAAAGSLVLAFLLLPHSRKLVAIETPLPCWDIPMRMLATFILVALITLTAEALGPELSGIAATFPCIVTVVGSFTHHQWGGVAARRMLRGLARSLFSFVAFFLVVGAIIPQVGLVSSFVVASAVALLISGAMLMFDRRQRLARA